MKRVVEENMVNNCLMLLTKVGETKTNHPSLKGKGGGGFKCKTCQRQFLSFQALGGHRASHKKLKLIDRNFSSPSPAKTKMHLCPVCGVEFAVGQALGGHMRKHKHRANSLNNYGNFVNNIHDHGARKLNLWLDLNLTPSENDLKLDLRTPVLDCFI